MAVCPDCKKNMSAASTVACTFPYVRVNGKVYRRNTSYHDVNARCHDCNVVNGNIHHFGCDIERCPACERQLIACNCKGITESLKDAPKSVTLSRKPSVTSQRKPKSARTCGTIGKMR